MRHPAHRATRRLFRDTHGATMTEYALMLFLVAVVAATGFRFLGKTILTSMDKAGGHLETHDDSPSQGNAPPPPGGATGATPSPPPTAKSDQGFGGPRVAEAPKEESSLGKFAMIALGVIGCGAAFFAAMKGKNAK